MENILDNTIVEEQSEQIIYIGFWPRLWALLLDALIFVPFAIIGYIFKDLASSVLLIYLIPLVQLLYKPLMEYTKGYTLGKLALGIKVVNSNFEKADLGQIILRNIFQIISQISSIIFSIMLIKGFYTVEVSGNPMDVIYQPHVIPSWIYFIIVIIEIIMMVSDDRKRTLHDHIGKTYVIKK